MDVFVAEHYFQHKQTVFSNGSQCPKLGLLIKFATTYTTKTYTYFSSQNYHTFKQDLPQKSISVLDLTFNIRKTTFLRAGRQQSVIKLEQGTLNNLNFILFKFIRFILSHVLSQNNFQRFYQSSACFAGINFARLSLCTNILLGFLMFCQAPKLMLEAYLK